MTEKWKNLRFMTGINTSVMDIRVLTVICVVVAHQSSNEPNVEHVWEIVRSDKRKSVDQIASESGISVENCHNILHDVLNMCRVCQHLLPWMLTRKKKWGRGMRMNISGALIDMADKDNKSLNPFQPRDAIWHHAFHLFLICMPFAHWLQ